MDYPIRIRVDSKYAGDRETETFTDSTFAEAVTAAAGGHENGSGYHISRPVYVVAVHAETHTVEGNGRSTRTVTYQAGEPMFGHEATVYGRETAYDSLRDARVSYASGGGTPAETAFSVRLITLAAQIAEAANAAGSCAACDAYRAEREAQFAAAKAAKAGA